MGMEIRGDGIGIVGADGYIGCGLHSRDAIAHSDAGAGQPEHFQVCKIIAKGGDPVYGQAAGGADGRQGIGLGGSGFGDLVPVFFTGKAANITVRQSRLQRFDLLIGGYLGTDLQRIQGKVPEIRPNDFRPGRVRGPLVAVIVPKMALQSVYRSSPYSPRKCGEYRQIPAAHHRGQTRLDRLFCPVPGPRRRSW